MSLRRGFGLAAAACALLASTLTQAATLYDASLGTAPSAQGWVSVVPPFATGTVSGGRYTLDTSSGLPPNFSNALLAGSSRLSPVLLNTSTGYELTIVMQVGSETHASANRAGFSIIAIGNDKTKSIELGFWQDRVFAYEYNGSDPDRFVRGPEYLVDTTSALRTYRLRVQNNLYSLYVDNFLAIGSRSLYDYTPFAGFPDVYEVPNFLFFGDDTTRARSIVSIASVTLNPVPLPAALPMLLSALAVLGMRRFGQSSPACRKR
jgi:hypothetical protein